MNTPLSRRFCTGDHDERPQAIRRLQETSRRWNLSERDDDEGDGRHPEP